MSGAAFRRTSSRSTKPRTSHAEVRGQGGWRRRTAERRCRRRTGLVGVRAPARAGLARPAAEVAQCASLLTDARVTSCLDLDDALKAAGSLAGTAVIV
jgi:hypothetical protein